VLPLDRTDNSMSEQPIPLEEPKLTIERGPVVVSVDYHLARGNEAAFLDAAIDLRRVRRRTGAQHWHLHRDVADPCYFEESFVVGSWEEHEQQHARLTGPDLAAVERIDALLEPGHPRQAHHALSVRPHRRPAQAPGRS
jgi:Transmembrane secretion effector